MSRILITGAAGFLGGYLCTLLKQKHQVIGLDVRPAGHRQYDAWVTVTSPSDAVDAINMYKPSLVVHAAFVNRKPVEVSNDSYLQAIVVNNSGFFDAAAGIDARFLLISSSAVYGAGMSRDVIDESCPRKPLTIYGLGKCVQETLADYSVSTRGLKLCTVRLFNLSGPGQPQGLLWADWLNRILAIENGAEPVLRVPHFRSSRDFVDVRDAAAAIFLIVENFRAGEIVNVASGVAASLSAIGDEMKRHCTRPFIIVETDPASAVNDTIVQCGSNGYIAAKWGWTPRISWRQSLADQWESIRSRDTGEKR